MEYNPVIIHRFCFFYWLKINKSRFNLNFSGWRWSNYTTVPKKRHRTAWKSKSLQWRHNGRDSVSYLQPHDCLLNLLFRRRSKKTPKLSVAGLCAGNSPGTGEYPAQMASNAENVSIWWRHHVASIFFRLFYQDIAKQKSNVYFREYIVDATMFPYLRIMACSQSWQNRTPAIICTCPLCSVLLALVQHRFLASPWPHE